MRGDRPRVIVEEFVSFNSEITLLTVATKDGVIFCPPVGHRQDRDGVRHPVGAQPGAVDRVERPAEFAAARLVRPLFASDAMPREPPADQLAHHALGVAIGLGHRVEGAVALVLRRDLGSPARQRFRPRSCSEIFGKGDQLGVVHP